MRSVFVAGGSGAIGRRLLPRLVRAGNRVTAMTRSPERAQQLRAVGVCPAVCDVYDEVALNAAVSEAKPDVVVHLLTDFPQRFRPRAATNGTDRIRRQGISNLLAAATAAGARRVVVESIAFLYAPGGSRIKEEESEPYLDAPAPFDSTVAAAVDLERQVLAASLEGVVLRFGQRRPRSSAVKQACTTSSTTSRLRCLSGCRRTPWRSAPRDRSACRPS